MADEPRTETIIVRVSESEKRAILRVCTLMRISISDLVRMMVLPLADVETQEEFTHAVTQAATAGINLIPDPNRPKYRIDVSSSTMPFKESDDD